MSKSSHKKTSEKSTEDSKEKAIKKRKVYEKRNYNLGDGAKVIHIPNYVNNPNALLEELLNKIPWRHFDYEVNGTEVMSPRLMNIVSFKPNRDNSHLPLLLKIKERLEKATNVKFKYAVLNYYRNGKDHIGFHSDREVKNGQIVVSVSVGAIRRFVLKHKFRKDVKHIFMPANGDVLILNTEAIKTVYRHAIMKSVEKNPRINITFREGN